MIKQFVDRFMENRPALQAVFGAKHPDTYKDLVQEVIKVITTPDEYGDNAINPERIHVIDDGDYQGTLLFIIGAKGYQPNEYWSVTVGYGSCSGCDTLEGIREYSNTPPTPAQVGEYMELALHVVQGLKKIAGYDL